MVPAVEEPCWGVADLIDGNMGGPYASAAQQESPLQVLQPGLRTYGGKKVFWGQVSTIRCLNTNDLVTRVAREPGHGRVMVIDAGGSLTSAVLGDIIAECYQRSGWAGLVVHGCIRDVEGLAALPIGVKALEANPMKPGKGQPGGQRDVPVVVGGAAIKPGDWLYADPDGVLVSPTELQLPTEQELEAIREQYFASILGPPAS